jgi:hypothetical protein
VASLLSEESSSTSVCMRGRLMLNGPTEIGGSFGEVSGSQFTLMIALWLQTMTMAMLSAGHTVEPQGSFRVANGYVAADHTAF